MSASTCSKLSPCSPLYIAFSNQQPSKGHSLRYHRLNRLVVLISLCVSLWSQIEVLNIVWCNRKRRLTKQTKEKKMAVLVKKEMEIKNLKLYMENKSIIEENEKLRKKALLLHQENQALSYLLQKKSSNTLHDNLAPNN